jgi:hypothetical protein
VGVGFIGAEKGYALHNLAVRSDETGAVLLHSRILRQKLSFWKGWKVVPSRFASLR